MRRLKLRERLAPAAGWSKPFKDSDRGAIDTSSKPSLSARQELSGALAFMAFWRARTDEDIAAAEDNIDLLLDIEHEVSAFTRAVVAFHAWRAT